MRLARGRKQYRRARKGTGFETRVLAGLGLCLQKVTLYLLNELQQLMLESSKGAESRSLTTMDPGEKDTRGGLEVC